MTSAEAIADAHERWAEQLQSDEHVLGMVPDAAAQLLLDHALTRLDAAARLVASVEQLDAAAEDIRQEARRLAEQAADTDDPATHLRDILAGAVTHARDAEAEVRPRADAAAADAAEPAGEPAPTPKAEDAETSLLGRLRRWRRRWW